MQGLPDKEHCLGPAALSIPPIGGGDLVQRRRLDRRDKPRDEGSDQYIVFGQSAGPAGRLPGAAGKKTWILGFGKQGKWICSTEDEVEALKVTGDLTLNRE